MDFGRYCWNLNDCNNYAVRRVVTEVCKNPKACYRHNCFGKGNPLRLLLN